MVCGPPGVIGREIAVTDVMVRDTEAEVPVAVDHLLSKLDAATGAAVSPRP